MHFEPESLNSPVSSLYRHPLERERVSSIACNDEGSGNQCDFMRYAGTMGDDNSTHLGNTRIRKNTYNRKMGFFPDWNPVFLLPIPPMLKKTTTATRSMCHPIPVVHGGGFAGRAGWFRSRAAVPFVSF
jgi:hypothetical protein